MTCIADCRVRYYIALCNCVPFFYPHLSNFNLQQQIYFPKESKSLFCHLDLPEYSSTIHCSFQHLPCLYEIRARMSGFEPAKGSVGFKGQNLTELGISCNECLPPCHDLVPTN